MEEQNKNITVLIAGRPYPLKVKSVDEPVIRRIVKDVNEQINKFQLTYSSKDKQDCLAMTLLTYAVDLHKSKLANVEDVAVRQKVESIDRLLAALVD